jgi:hypothetical protein
MRLFYAAEEERIPLKYKYKQSLLNGLKLRPLMPTFGLDYAMGKNGWVYMKRKIKKTVVPPRKERMEKIGNPKTPKMGGITPKNIEVPEVDDLLDKMKKAFSDRSFTNPDLVNVKNLYRQGFSYDIETESQGHSRCSINCGCAPCLRGECGRCTEDVKRREAMRNLIAGKYSGLLK